MEGFKKYTSRKNFLLENGFTGDVTPQTWALFTDHNNKTVYVGVNSLDTEDTLVLGYRWEFKGGRKNGNYKKAQSCIEFIEKENYSVLGFHFNLRQNLYSKPSPHFLVKKNDGWHAIPKIIDGITLIDLADTIDLTDEASICGNQSPQKYQKFGTVYERDVRVAAKTLKFANGKCELCDKPTFLKKNGKPFLEVHHVLPLSQEGSDTVTNTVALCPNCHKELHFGAQSTKLTSKLYDKVPRLVKEKSGRTS